MIGYMQMRETVTSANPWKSFRTSRLMSQRTTCKYMRGLWEEGALNTPEGRQPEPGMKEQSTIWRRVWGETGGIRDQETAES